MTSQSENPEPEFEDGPIESEHVRELIEEHCEKHVVENVVRIVDDLAERAARVASLESENQWLKARLNSASPGESPF